MSGALGKCGHVAGARSFEVTIEPMPASCAAGGGECLAAPHRASATDPAPRAADFARSRNGIRGGTDYRTSNSSSYAERQLSSRSVSPGTGSTQSPSW